MGPRTISSIVSAFVPMPFVSQLESGSLSIVWRSMRRMARGTTPRFDAQSTNLRVP